MSLQKGSRDWGEAVEVFFGGVGRKGGGMER